MAQIEVHMETQEKRKPIKTPRVVPSKADMLMKGEINHMVPTIPISTHNMATKIEDEPLPWYLFNALIDLYTGEILQYKYLMKLKDKKRDLWKNIPSKEFGRLADGFPGKVKKGTNNIRFFACNNIPVIYTITYSHIVVNVKTQKEDPILLRLTVGGNRIEYPGKLTTKTSYLTTLKIHINYVIST